MTRRRWASWAWCCVVGTVLVALPDRDQRLVSFSRDHGPSVVDTLGVAVLLAGWLVLDHAAWGGRRRLVTRLGRGPLLVGALLAGLGVGLVIASVLGDLGYWWVAGAAVAAAVQLVAALAVTGETG